jgi:hypothetical protein
LFPTVKKLEPIQLADEDQFSASLHRCIAASLHRCIAASLHAILRTIGREELNRVFQV